MTSVASKTPANGREPGLPPHDIGSEEAVLSALLLTDEALAVVRPLLEPRDFFRERDSWVYSACLSVADRGEPITIVTVARQLVEMALLDEAGGESFLVELGNNYVAVVGVEAHARLVAELANRRRLIERAAEVVRAAHTGVGLESALADLVNTPAEPSRRPEIDPLALRAELRIQRTRSEARRQLAREQRSATPAPEVLTLAERLARPRPPFTYRIQGLQPSNSRVMFAAQAKTGKSTTVGNLVRSAADGRRLFGVAEVTAVTGTVVLLDTEMGERQLVDWLADQGVEHSERVVVVPLRGRLSSFDILDRDCRREWVETLQAVSAEYVILDCLRPALDALGLDENHDAGRFLVAFDELLVEAGVPDAVVVHHMGHNGERSRGDSRIRDWPDVEWRLVRASEEPDSPRYFSAFGRDVAFPETLLHYEPVTRRLTLSAGSRKDARATEVLPLVIDALVAEGPLSQRGVERAVSGSGHGKDVIREALTLGVQQGELIRDRRAGRGAGYLYALPAQLSELSGTAAGAVGTERTALIESAVRSAVTEAGVSLSSEANPEVDEVTL